MANRIEELNYVPEMPEKARAMRLRRLYMLRWTAQEGIRRRKISLLPDAAPIRASCLPAHVYPVISTRRGLRGILINMHPNM